MRDLCACVNCGWVGTVATGDEVCPACLAEGNLSWIDGEPEEVPDDFDPSDLVAQFDGEED